MAGSGHVLVTSGRSGSIKVWPEATLRFAAMEANIQLPCGQGAVSQVSWATPGPGPASCLLGWHYGCAAVSLDTRRLPSSLLYCQASWSAARIQ